MTRTIKTTQGTFDADQYVVAYLSASGVLTIHFLSGLSRTFDRREEARSIYNFLGLDAILDTTELAGKEDEK